ncbi:MAG: glycoside hydrolase family 65 protein [Bdellovibrionales bacterium]|nr:glycoside hydrolase family 65 protein [Bdellovibrionales bacterium]
MIRHQNETPPPEDIYPIDEWNIVETQFNPELMGQTETIFATANGYMGWRGNFPEGKPSVQNGTFINRFYESWPITYGEAAFGFAKTGQTMVNVTDGRTIKLYVDDEPFDLARANVAKFERRLDMRNGTLERDILWETPGGLLVEISSKSMISFVHRHLGVIYYSVKVINSDAPLAIASIVRGTQENPVSEGDPRQSRGFIKKVLLPEQDYCNEKRVILNHITDASKMRLACGIDHEIETDCPVQYRSRSEPDYGEVVFDVHAKLGRPINLIKYVTYHTSRTADALELKVRSERSLDKAAGTGLYTLLAEQRNYLDDFWARSDVSVEGNGEFRIRRPREVQQALRWNLFQIIQSSARVDGSGVGAKGLTGQGYEGHYFWDSDIYVMPFLIYTNPQIAKNLLLFRYSMLDKARERAEQVNQRGALFPWRTINGEEASAYYAAGTAQYHINADIMYSMKKYVAATDDQEFLRTKGAEMLVETARLWFDLGFYSEQKNGHFCINGVTGPDEYNTVVNNNLYTNMMARENLQFAARTVADLKNEDSENYANLVRRTKLQESEITNWQEAADQMYLPFDEERGIHLQDDGFLQRKPFDFENTPKDKYPLLLYHHPLVIYRSMVIKQADVVLAMFLLGNRFSVEQKRKNFYFYEPLTTGDSSLSACIQSILAAEVGDPELAIRYGLSALLMDLADIGGNVKDGCHIASMGGSWMAAVFGFAGFSDYDGIYAFNPRLPKEVKHLSFHLMLHRQRLHIDLHTDCTIYTLERDGTGLKIFHKGSEVELEPGTALKLE